MAVSKVSRFVLAAAATLAPFAAHAAPMGTSPDTLRDKAKVVVLGKVTTSPRASGGYDLAIGVDAVVRGKAPLGRMIVRTSPDGTVLAPDQRVVSLLDGDALRWMGTLVAGPSLEQGVIHLYGFFDFNAHIVQPGIVTLPQLRTFLDTGKLDQKFALTLAFYDGVGTIAPSAKKLQVGWSLPLPASAATSPPKVTGTLPKCLQPLALSNLDWGGFELSFADKCRGSFDRRLDLEGRFTGVEPDGAIAVEVVPIRPFVTEREYETFAADAGILDVQRIVSVRADDGSAYTWRLGEGFVDAKGKLLAPGGMSASSETNNGVTTDKSSYEFGDLWLTLSNDGTGRVSTGGSARDITMMIASGKPFGCTLARKGANATRCVLRNEPPRFVRAK